MAFEYDSKWGLDHGAWVALGGLFPKGTPGNVPVYMISVNSAFNIEEHVKLGKTIGNFIDTEAELGNGWIFVGSGSVCHNLRVLFSIMQGGGNKDDLEKMKKFDDSINKILLTQD